MIDVIRLQRFAREKEGKIKTNLVPSKRKEMTRKDTRDMLLAGDIGGTKTNLAVYTPAAGRLGEPRLAQTFPSAEYSSLEAIIQEFLRNLDAPIEYAAFGVAGPV